MASRERKARLNQLHNSKLKGGREAALRICGELHSFPGRQLKILEMQIFVEFHPFDFAHGFGKIVQAFGESHPSRKMRD
jgi:hypothetical protein